MNTVVYANAVPVGERVREPFVPCVPHVYLMGWRGDYEERLRNRDALLTQYEKDMRELREENARLRDGAASMRTACLGVVEKMAVGCKDFDLTVAALHIVASSIAALPLTAEAAPEG